METGAGVVGRTLVSTDPDLVWTNANGVAGNPSITTAITGVGLIPGGQIQTPINYFGEIFNTQNGFSQYGTADKTVPANSVIGVGTPLAPTDDGTLIGHPYGFGTTNPGYDAATATFTVPTTTPAQNPVQYQIDATCTFTWVDGATGTLELQVFDLDHAPPVNIDDAQVNGNANALPGFAAGSLSFGGRYMLTPGHRYQLGMINTDGVQSAIVTFWHWNAVRVM